MISAGLLAGVGGDDEGALGGGGARGEVGGHAAEAVAAHLGAAAVGVPHDHPRERAAAIDDEHPVGADTEAAIAEGARRLGADGGRGVVHEDEVVAEALPLLELERAFPHRVALLRARSGGGGADAVDGDDLGAAARADDDRHVGGADEEGLGDQAQELAVGGAVGRRGRERHVEGAVPHAEDRRARGARAHPNVEAHAAGSLVQVQPSPWAGDAGRLTARHGS